MHSTERTPQNWAHPLCLLMQHRSHDTHMTNPTAPGRKHTVDPGGVFELVLSTVFVYTDKENERLDAAVSTPLPPTLPLSCFHPTLHHVQQQVIAKTNFISRATFYSIKNF